MRSLFTGLGLSPLGVVALMMLILVILGTFMEWIAIAFITVPVFAPVVVGMAPELGLRPSLGSSVVWSIICYEYTNLFLIATLWASLFLAKVSCST